MSEKGREVYHPLMASTECKAQALSAVSVTVETAAHISISPRESKTPPGDQGREISKTRKENISSAVRFPCQAQGSKEEEEEGGEGWRGWGMWRVTMKTCQQAAIHPSLQNEQLFVTIQKTKRKSK